MDWTAIHHSRRCWGHRILSNRWGGVYIRENGTICPLALFPVCGIRIFRVKIWHFPLTGLCFEVQTGPFRGPKRTNGEFGIREPKTAKMPTKTRKTQQDQIGLMTGIGLEFAKKKDNGSIVKQPCVALGAQRWSCDCMLLRKVMRRLSRVLC